jgi:hypothetical protein
MFGRNQIERGQRGGAGLGFRGSSPPYPYIGRGRGGLPRCAYPGSRANLSFPAFNTPVMSREQEISLLKTQAETIRKELEAVESRIHDLETK